MAGTAKRMQQRRGTSSEWASLDPVLLAGEFGVETDTGVVKVGDGVKAWSGLEEIGGGGGYDDTNIRSLIAAKQDAGNYVVKSDTGVLTATDGKIANIKYSKVNNIATVELNGIISIEFKTRSWTSVWNIPEGFAPKHLIYAVGVINTQPHETCMLLARPTGTLNIAAMYTDSPADVQILGTITYVCA